MSLFGRKGGDGPNTGKKAQTFRCELPGILGPANKSIFKREDMTDPVSLWYQDRAGTWYLNTVVDRSELPKWSKVYTIGTAELI